MADPVVPLEFVPTVLNAARNTGFPLVVQSYSPPHPPIAPTQPNHLVGFGLNLPEHVPPVNTVLKSYFVPPGPSIPSFYAPPGSGTLKAPHTVPGAPPATKPGPYTEVPAASQLPKTEAMSWKLISDVVSKTNGMKAAFKTDLDGFKSSSNVTRSQFTLLLDQNLLKDSSKKRRLVDRCIAQLLPGQSEWLDLMLVCQVAQSWYPPSHPRSLLLQCQLRPYQMISSSTRMLDFSQTGLPL